MGQEGKRASTGRSAVRHNIIARFGRDRRGSTAIEFAALAIPFSMLVFAILESCLSFAGREVLTNATDDIARQLRTGQLRGDAITEASLEQRICDRLQILMANRCSERLQVDLRNFSTYLEAANYSYKIENNEVVLMKGATKDTDQFVVRPGGETTINMLRVFYRWPVITDFMAKWMASVKFDGTANATLHFATTTWVNEPYGS